MTKLPVSGKCPSKGSNVFMLLDWYMAVVAKIHESTAQCQYLADESMCTLVAYVGISIL